MRDGQPFGETDLLELDVALRELPLLAKGDGLAGVVPQRVTQHVAELLDGALRPRRVLPHEGPDGVQRVEEKVRVQPAPQGLQSRPGERRFRAEGAALVLARTALRLDRVRHAGDEAVEPHPHQKLPADGLRHLQELEDRFSPHDRVRQEDRRDPHGRVNRGGREVLRVEARPHPRGEGMARAEEPDRDAEHRGGADRDGAPPEGLGEAVSPVRHEDPEQEKREPGSDDRQCPREQNASTHG